MKKMVLRRETLRVLSNVTLSKVPGGDPDPLAVSDPPGLSNACTIGCSTALYTKN